MKDCADMRARAAEFYPSTGRLRGLASLALLFVVALTASACSDSSSARPAATERHSSASTTGTSTRASTSTTEVDSSDVYAHTHVGDLSPAVKDVPERVYVPNSKANSLDVIDPKTYQVIDHYRVGDTPHHVTPSWDLKTLYVDNTRASTLIPIDPSTGKPGTPIPVTDPYNLYFTLDGHSAIVVAERYRRLDIRDPHTWKLRHSVSTPCTGPDHLDFSADGSYLIVSCEFSGDLVKVDTQSWQVTGTFHVGGLPVDVRISPDGSVFYVANQGRNGVSVIDGDAMRELEFIPTAKGAHGLYPSRDGKLLYVTNRLAGSISVIDFSSRKIVDTWRIGGTPDMGGVSPDGSELWITGRYNASVYVVDTRTGELTHTIKVGAGAHGLCFFPQPGRFSLGHTGNYR